MSNFLSVLLQFLSVAATAGVISGLLANFLSQRQIKKEQCTASAYAAIRLAVLFEHFADDCVDVLSQNEGLGHSPSGLKKSVSQVPRLLAFPADDAGWKALEPSLLNEVLSFQQRIKMADGIIASALTNATRKDAVIETNDQCIMLGARAWKLAEKLRRNHNFAPLALEFPFHEHLLTQLPGVIQRRQAFGSLEKLDGEERALIRQNGE